MPRRPGQHARETARRHARRAVAVGVLVAALGCAAVVGTGFDPAVAVLAEVAVVAGVVWIHRRAGRTESAPEGWEPGWCRFASLP